MARIRFKICCMASIEEARLAVAYGASALGLVSAMPSGPGVISDDLATEIAQTVPPGVSSFLLTSETNPIRIVEQQRAIRPNTLQLVDELDHSSYAVLRAELPGIALVQVIHVMGERSISEAEAVSPHVDAILLDSGNPTLAVKELGGTGQVHDWEISRAIRERVSMPIFLAGGLNAGNVAEAIRLVQPYAVDVCSGVRTDSRLDEEKLAALVESVGSAYGIVQRD